MTTLSREPDEHMSMFDLTALWLSGYVEGARLALRLAAMDHETGNLDAAGVEEIETFVGIMARESILDAEQIDEHIRGLVANIISQRQA